jgi:hypothetical protein
MYRHLRRAALNLLCHRSAQLFLACFALAGFGVSAAANDPSFWQDRAAQAGADTFTLGAPAQEYRAIRLDLAGLRSTLDTAPAERSNGAPLMLALPMPDGSTQVFAVYRTQVMTPRLAARYPLIRSYAGRSVDHPEIEARLDDSPHGFSAMIRGPGSVAMLQPVALGEGADYISFQRAAIGAQATPFHCLLDGQVSLAAQLHHATEPDSAPTPQTTTGAQIRTYRLALAATAEYTATFGGTVADGMAAIVQAINRVNGIYLTEFAVQFQLVNGNDQLVYTDPANEPYTDGDGVAMLGQNQANIDNVIGSANYDFGHVFSTGGGGVADVGVPCNAGTKAQGVTGSPAPTGDAYWVDYVAHEMGHQMGALHSFNSTSGNCGGGNRTPSQAAEPGSGSTIMAYAGICAPSDLQPHSDPFFHAISLVPIAQVLAGSGATCGTVLSTTNQAPSVSPVPAFTIPKQTPFMLTGAATDADNDPITFVWEQMNLGTASPPETDNGTRPLFRSFVPSSSPTRLVPELPRILSHNLATGIPSGGNISGETWAITTRDLNFRLTVRDNHPGGGASASTDAVVHVTNTSGPFLVTAPAAAAQWPANTQRSVHWNVANTTAAPVSCTAVDVLYSADGGQTFPATLASRVPNSGSASVIVPNLPTSNARIEVLCHGNIFFDISPGNFTIVTDDIFMDGFEGAN